MISIGFVGTVVTWLLVMIVTALIITAWWFLQREIIRNDSAHHMLRKEFGAVDAQLRHVNERLDVLASRFDRVDERVDALAARSSIRADPGVSG